MASLTEIYNWFKTGKKPTQAQFWASWGSFWHKEETIPQSAITNLASTLNSKTEISLFEAHIIDEYAHSNEASEGIDFEGELEFYNVNGIYYNKLVLADFGSIPFSVKTDPKPKTGRSVYILIESDARTPLSTPEIMERVFKSGLENLPSNYILPAGTYEFYLLKTPTGVALNFKIYDRSVVDLDTEKPVIRLNGTSPISIDLDSDYIDEGAIAEDDVDGNITASIVTVNNVNTAVAGSYTVKYNVKDAAENEADEVVRNVTVLPVPDTTKPIITINGENPIEVNLGSFYTDAGAKAHDDVDGNLTSIIEKVSTVNTAVVGTYTVKYNVQDAAKNDAIEKVRTVVVVEPTSTTDVTRPDTLTIVEIILDDDGVVQPILDTEAPDTLTIEEIILYDTADTEVPDTLTIEEIILDDTTKPVITMNGDASIEITTGTTYTDAGATAQDDVDGVITDDIVTVNNVNKDVAGTYLVTYNVQDSSQNSAIEKVRTIVVADEIVTGVSFQDSFSGTSIDETKWNPRGLFISQNEKAMYDGNVTNTPDTLDYDNGLTSVESFDASGDLFLRVDLNKGVEYDIDIANDGDETGFSFGLGDDSGENCIVLTHSSRYAIRTWVAVNAFPVYTDLVSSASFNKSYKISKLANGDVEFFFHNGLSWESIGGVTGTPFDTGVLKVISSISFGTVKTSFTADNVYLSDVDFTEKYPSVNSNVLP